MDDHGTDVDITTEATKNAAWVKPGVQVRTICDSVLQAYRIVVFATLLLSAASVLRPSGS